MRPYLLKLKTLSNSLKKIFLTSFILLLVDQVTKLLVKNFMQIGEEIIIFDWFRLHFIENSGMAYGIGSDWGEIAKFFLTFFRIVVVIFGVFYIRRVISEKQLPGRLLICLGMIIGGALGNVIDSVFYGFVFDETSFFQGKVVDMLYFPLTGESYFLPDWLPFFGGNHFIFFRPIFNIADAGIFIGITCLLIFYRRYFQ